MGFFCNRDLLMVLNKNMRFFLIFGGINDQKCKKKRGSLNLA